MRISDWSSDVCSSDVIEAAQNLGFPACRSVLLHLRPNCIGPIMVFATIQIATAITLEATLSFLGVGVPVTEPSLGLLIASGFEYLLSGEDRKSTRLNSSH